MNFIDVEARDIEVLFGLSNFLDCEKERRKYERKVRKIDIQHGFARIRLQLSGVGMNTKEMYAAAVGEKYATMLIDKLMKQASTFFARHGLEWCFEGGEERRYAMIICKGDEWNLVIEDDSIVDLIHLSVATCWCNLHKDRNQKVISLLSYCNTRSITYV